MGAITHVIATLENNLERLTLHVYEDFYPIHFNAVVGRRWLLTHGIKLVFIKCLNYPD